MAEPTTIEVAIGDVADEVVLPAGVLDAFTAEGQSSAEAVGDVLTMSCTQRLHAAVAHSAGEPDDEIEQLESTMREQFEERFGASFAEVTGHHH